MNKRILILDNAIDHCVYYPVEHWAPHLIFPFDLFHASAKKFPADIDEYSHIILTGSEASIIDDSNWQEREMQLVRTAIAKGKPVLGSCYGHQLIARALFGKGAVRRRKAPGVGWKSIKVLKRDPLFGKRDEVHKAFVIHFDEVCNLPHDEVDVMATSDYCEVQGFKVKGAPVYGIQSHPEIGIEEGFDTIDRMIKKGVDHADAFMEAKGSKPSDSGWIAPLMKAFQEIAGN